MDMITLAMLAISNGLLKPTSLTGQFKQQDGLVTGTTIHIHIITSISKVSHGD